MIEKRVEVKTYIVKAICENCDGEYVYNGNVLTTYPAQYGHTCQKCGHHITLDCCYPTTEYVEIEDDTYDN